MYQLVHGAAPRGLPGRKTLRRAGLALGSLLAVLGVAVLARAAPSDGAIILPTVTPVGEGGASSLRRPVEKDGPLVERAREVDSVLADAAQDLGLSLDVGRRAGETPQARDVDFADSAKGLGTWVFSPRIERDGSELLVRIVAMPPGGRVVLVRSERVSAETMPVRLVVMLRDLVRANAGKTAPEPTATRPAETSPAGVQTRSSGRSVLALGAAAYGGFLGYALQKAGGGDDPRLLYPLIALGTGVGLGASTIVADEWDVSTADASYVAAGAGWSSLGAFSLAEGYHSGSADRYGYALGGGALGLAAAAFSLSKRDVTDGQATLTHSGAGYATFLGASTELLVRGSTSGTPYRGLGYGALGGVVAAGALAPRFSVTSTRVLTVDLAVVLGGLVGAAAGSPLLLGDETPGRQRAWVGLTVLGSALGAGGALLLTRRPSPPLGGATMGALRRLAPSPAVVGVTEVRGRPPVPALGAAWYGTF